MKLFHFRKKITFSDLIGKTVLVGFTYYSADHELVERKQFWGTVTHSDEKQILVRQSDGEILSLPPDLSSTKRARPGEYRLHTTGEVVVNPDYLITWNITRTKE